MAQRRSSCLSLFASFSSFFFQIKKKDIVFLFCKITHFQRIMRGRKLGLFAPRSLWRGFGRMSVLWRTAHRRMAFLRCADRTSPPPKAWFFPRWVRMKIFSFVRRRNFIYEFFAIKISVTFCKAKRVCKLGQRVPRHQI